MCRMTTAASFSFQFVPACGDTEYAAIPLFFPDNFFFRFVLLPYIV